jgi:hypothetical protein
LENKQSPIPDDVTFSLTNDPSQALLSTKGHFVLLKVNHGSVTPKFVPVVLNFIDRIEILADRKSLGLIKDEHICLRGVSIADDTGRITLYIDHLKPLHTGPITLPSEIEEIFLEDYLEVRVRQIRGVSSGAHVFRNAPGYYTELYIKMNWDL